MIERLVERVLHARTIDTVVIATSDEPSDDPLAELAGRISVGCYRGSLPNIMERIKGAADTHRCDTIVEILGDNPLVHSDLIDEVVSLHRKGSFDYTASITNEYPTVATTRALFAVGIRVQVYSPAVANRQTDFPEYIEASGKDSSAYIYEHPKTFKLGFLEARGRWASLNRPELNFAVNYRKNFEMVKTIFERFYPHDRNFTLEQAMEFFNKEKVLRSLMGA